MTNLARLAVGPALRAFQEGREQAQKQRSLSALAALGADVQSGTPLRQAGANALANGAPLSAFSTLAELAHQDRSFDRQQERDAVSDQRDARDFKLRKTQLAQRQSNSERQHALALKEFELNARRIEQQIAQGARTPEEKAISTFRARQRIAQEIGLDGDDLDHYLATGKLSSRGANNRSLTPVFGTDEQGNTVLMQVDRAGNAVRTKLPEGVKPSAGIKTLDTGTGHAILNKRTGAMQGQVSKDLAGAESQKFQGKAQGKAAANLPSVIGKASEALNAIQKLRDHPGFSSAVGVQGLFPGVPGTSQNDFIVALKQAQGQVFLEAFESLKGGGHITEIEGVKGEQAKARLDRTQSEEEFLVALDDLEQVIRAGVQRAHQRAGHGTGNPSGVSTTGSGVQFRVK